MKSAYLDGELCALNVDGVPVFSRLQAAMDEGRTDQQRLSRETFTSGGASRSVASVVFSRALLGRDRDRLTIDELAEYLDFRAAKLELRLHRSVCSALEPAKSPHEQKDRDWNAQ